VTLNGREITPLPANHVIPSVGYQLNSGKKSLVFTGDTTTQDDFWKVVNRIDNLGYLIIETAFPNAETDLAVLSKHLCPSLLAKELEKLRLDPQIYITHLKPDEGELTMQEISNSVKGLPPMVLMNGQVFEF
jgi:ribonuclease BN (tRNA processing enzyme)